MKRLLLLVALGGLLAGVRAESRAIAIQWSGGLPEGRIVVDRGRLVSLRAEGGEARDSGEFRARAGGFRLEAVVEGSTAPDNSGAAVVSVRTKENPFSFFLRDARAAYPIYLPAYGVAVSEGSDRRSAVEIQKAIRARGLKSKLERIEAAPEASFERALGTSRESKVPTWLGLGRDVRIFEIGERVDSIRPRFHGSDVRIPEVNGAVGYEFLAGRGWGAADHITRRLDEGVLPVLQARIKEEEVVYELTLFVGLERTPLQAGNVRGTHYLVADGYGGGHMFTPAQQAEHDRLQPLEMNQDEETVLYVRVRAVNTGQVPRYAFFRSPAPRGRAAGVGMKDGLSAYGSGRVFAAVKLGGRPAPQAEMAVELEPGGRAVFEAYVPHRPVTAERGRALARAGFEEKLAECRTYWKGRLSGAAKMRVPEQRVDEMIRAGLLHLDLVQYGREPEGTLVPAIGVYTAIGSESSPIIQFMDSMGWHKEARRALEFFLDKQHEDGFIQNFGGYMLETGAALWSLGEHYRYTRDEAWARRVAPKVTRACEYLERWRARNLREELRGRGYGMLEGKTADPEDLFRSFMLNGYAYLGLQRASEMLERAAPAEAARWRRLASELKVDIRAALFENLAKSPVVPLANGMWTPTCAPWAEYRGPLSLYADGGAWYTHGSMVSRDSLLGPLYLVFQEVLDPGEPAARSLLEFHSDLMTENNTAFSQPYYSRHAAVHLRRGEVRPFLAAYYNTAAALADRETYTFWEHYYHVSPHKTHEEGWFLMDTRWMLYREQGDTLWLLSGIPSGWLASGRSIELEGVASYFGPLAVRVKAEAKEVRAVVECKEGRGLKTVVLRLPDAAGRRPVEVTGGEWDAGSGRVTVRGFRGRAEVRVRYE